LTEQKTKKYQGGGSIPSSKALQEKGRSLQKGGGGGLRKNCRGGPMWWSRSRFGLQTMGRAEQKCVRRLFFEGEKTNGRKGGSQRVVGGGAGGGK